MHKRFKCFDLHQKIVSFPPKELSMLAVTVLCRTKHHSSEVPMKITPNTYSFTQLERPQQKNSQEHTASGNPKPSSSAVALSSTARHLQQVQSSAGDIDMERVQALRTAIANGTMEINTDRIADNLLASTRELLK